MLYQLVVPGPIEDVEETRVLEWHRTEGQAVEAGTLLVELETHKAVVEVRTARQGVLRRVLCQPGDWQKVGMALALLTDAPDEAVPEGANDSAPVFPVEFEIT